MTHHRITEPKYLQLLIFVCMKTGYQKAFKPLKYIIVLLIVILMAQLSLGAMRDDTYLAEKPDSFNWTMLTLNNKIMRNYPVLKPESSVNCNYYGCNTTTFAIVEWSMEYTSNANTSTILKHVQNYLKGYGYSLKPSGGILCTHEDFPGAKYYSAYPVGKDVCTITLVLTSKKDKTDVGFFYIAQ